MQLLLPYAPDMTHVVENLQPGDDPVTLFRPEGEDGNGAHTVGQGGQNKGQGQVEDMGEHYRS